MMPAFPPVPDALVLADTLPKAETKTPTAGTMPMAPRADHQHPRLTSASNHTLGSDGFVDVIFTRTFDQEPAIVCLALGSSDPVPDFTATPVKTGDVWTGARIYGERKRALPLLTGLVLIGPVVTALAGFKPWEPAAGARVSVIALQAS